MIPFGEDVKLGKCWELVLIEARASSPSRARGILPQGYRTFASGENCS